MHASFALNFREVRLCAWFKTPPLMMLQAVINISHRNVHELTVNYFNHGREGCVHLFFWIQSWKLFFGPLCRFGFFIGRFRSQNKLTALSRPVVVWHPCACEMTGLPLTRRMANSASVFKSISHFWKVPVSLHPEVLKSSV